MDILYWSRFRMRVIGRCDLIIPDKKKTNKQKKKKKKQKRIQYGFAKLFNQLSIVAKSRVDNYTRQKKKKKINK